MYEQNQYNNNATSNNSQYVEYSALSIRLDVSRLIDQIEMFLRGQKEYAEENENGRVMVKKVSIGKPLANDIGIQNILNSIQSIVNNQSVQGNLTREEYKYMIYEIHVNLAYDLVRNSNNWDIKTTRVTIMNNIMNLMQTFLSRLIDNEERNSYKETIKISESNTIKEGSKGFLNLARN